MKHTLIEDKRISFWILLLAILCISLLSLRCNNDNGNSIVEPMNPGIKPVVVSTYPLNGTTGPFENIYSPGQYYQYTGLPHFYVQFNKIMDISSFTKENVKIQGFDIPVTVHPFVQYPIRVPFRLSDLYPYSSDLYGDILGFTITDDVAQTTAVYKIKAIYTVTIDSTVKDLNGNRLGYQFKFSFTPEPYFRVVDFNFEEGDTLDFAWSAHVYFNNKIPSQTAQAVSLSPDPGGHWRLNSQNNYDAYFSSQGSVASGTKFTVTVPPNSADVSGNVIRSAVSRSFYQRVFQCTGSNLNSSNGISLNTQVYLYFSYPLDTSTARSALQISPAIPYTLSAENTVISFIPAHDFNPDADYTITLTNQLHAYDGTPLPGNIVIPFHTGKFTCTISPNDGQTQVYRSTSIALYFTGGIDTSTIRSSFGISPPVNGRFTFYNSSGPPYEYTTAVFYVSQQLSAYTQYTVTLSNGVRSIANYPLDQSVTSSFTTGQ